MDAARSSKTLVSYYITKQCQEPRRPQHESSLLWKPQVLTMTFHLHVSAIKTTRFKKQPSCHPTHNPPCDYIWHPKGNPVVTVSETW